MLHASTSPFYPLFAALDINAKIHQGESGRRLWAECVELGIEARKAIIANCKMIQPFVPPVIGGRPWQDHPTELIARKRRFFSFEPGDKWHGFAATPRINILSIPANCCSPRRALMRRRVNTPISVFRRPFWRTTCVKTVLCRRSAISTRSSSC